MYDDILRHIAGELDGVEGVKALLLGLEEVGETPSIRLFLNTAEPPDAQSRRPTRRETVQICAQIDSFRDGDRRASYLEALAIVSRVKARIESWRLAGRSGVSGPVTYRLMRLPDADAAVHLLTVNFEAAVDENGETKLLLAPLR